MLREAILAYPEVEEIVDLRTTHVGPASLLVAARLGFRDGVDSGRIEEVSAGIERELRDAVADVGEVCLDPTGRVSQEAGERRGARNR